MYCGRKKEERVLETHSTPEELQEKDLQLLTSSAPGAERIRVWRERLTDAIRCNHPKRMFALLGQAPNLRPRNLVEAKMALHAINAAQVPPYMSAAKQLTEDLLQINYDELAQRATNDERASAERTYFLPA